MEGGRRPRSSGRRCSLDRQAAGLRRTQNGRFDSRQQNLRWRPKLPNFTESATSCQGSQRDSDGSFVSAPDSQAEEHKHHEDEHPKLNVENHEPVDTVDCTATLKQFPNTKDMLTNTNALSSREKCEPARQTLRPVSLEKDASCFDICPGADKGPVRLKPALFIKNREKRSESAKDHEIKELMPGMVVLKRFISHTDQVDIVKTCRELGLGSGGFYQPGYSDGSKLHLKMMCLGKNWNPETSTYEDLRSYDGMKPPSIPPKFKSLVDKAILASHAHVKYVKPRIQSVEEVLPKMSPDLCIINFYTDSGKLGLHQDKDESRESLEKALPVVSFSFGDSADFAYNEQRDIDNAHKVVLESGDVLIFGGKSRMIFHGVPRIHSGSAPQLLIEETNLRPGRLNLTFRKY